jgi:hypothetical protein
MVRKGKSDDHEAAAAQAAEREQALNDSDKSAAPWPEEELKRRQKGSQKLLKKEADLNLS